MIKKQVVFKMAWKKLTYPTLCSELHTIRTTAFLVTVEPLEYGVVLVTFLAVDVGGGCTASSFALVDVRTD